VTVQLACGTTLAGILSELKVLSQKKDEKVGPTMFSQEFLSITSQLLIPMTLLFP
jgi:hypothetical protein